MENNKNINNKYVSIDSLYDTFSDSIDMIPMIISSEDIETFYVDTTEYVTVQDFTKIKNIIYQKRKNKEFLIQNNSKLLSYEPCSKDTAYFLNIIYELNESHSMLITENNNLQCKIKELEERLSNQQSS